jgi:hypothetical protein
MNSTTAYSTKLLTEKIGINPNMPSLIIGMPDSVKSLIPAKSVIFIQSIDSLPVNMANFGLVWLFATDDILIHAVKEQIISQLGQKAFFWISWPKKSSKIQTSLSENILRDILLPLGIVDTKVCAVDNTWSALKFVWRKK